MLLQQPAGVFQVAVGAHFRAGNLFVRQTGGKGVAVMVAVQPTICKRCSIESAQARSRTESGNSVTMRYERDGSAVRSSVAPGTNRVHAHDQEVCPAVALLLARYFDLCYTASN